MVEQVFFYTPFVGEIGKLEIIGVFPAKERSDRSADGPVMGVGCFEEDIFYGIINRLEITTFHVFEKIPGIGFQFFYHFVSFYRGSAVYNFEFQDVTRSHVPEDAWYCLMTRAGFPTATE
jgi:hypothetical protein